jgi:hypothetical protein
VSGLTLERVGNLRGARQLSTLWNFFRRRIAFKLQGTEIAAAEFGDCVFGPFDLFQHLGGFIVPPAQGPLNGFVTRFHGVLDAIRLNMVDVRRSTPPSGGTTNRGKRSQTIGTDWSHQPFHKLSWLESVKRFSTDSFFACIRSAGKSWHLQEIVIRCNAPLEGAGDLQ